MKENKDGMFSIRKTFLILVIMFILVFLLRWGYEFYFANHDIVIQHNTNYPTYESSEYDEKSAVRNVATEKISQKDMSGQAITIDQKYEKTAHLSSTTSNFQEENDELRIIIKDNEAMIQIENMGGLEGNRNLDIAIGVMPDLFDTFIESLKGIGTINSFNVNKVDKTEEFRTLMAEQEALKKTRESYVAMKEKGTNIQDLIHLEDKLTELEKNLQDLGVSIGTYATENSFCTINFTLKETGKPEVSETSVRFILRCAKISFYWTIKAFVLLIVLIGVALASIAGILKLLQFVKTIYTENIHTPEKRKNYVIADDKEDEDENI